MYSYTQQQTAATREVPYLKAEASRRGVHIAAHHPTAPDLIPLIEQRLADHQNHFARTMDPSSGYYTEWKTTHDDLTQFLRELEVQKSRVRHEVPLSLSQPDAVALHEPALRTQSADDDTSAPQPTRATNQNNSPRANTGQTEEPIPLQQNPNWPDSGQTVANTGQAWPNAGHEWPDPCQPLPNAGHSSPPAEALAGATNDDREHDDDENEEEENDAEDKEDQDDLDIQAELAGYANHAELMAEAAADLQAALNKRNKFDALSPDAQAAIITLLDKYDSRHVARLLIKPPPIGMSFKISKSGLNYFRRRFEKTQAQRRANENAKAAADLLDRSEDPDKAFQNTLERLLRLRALTTMSDPNAPLETIDALVNSLTKLRKQSLAERKQLHTESQ
jgi:hypothetical protein